MSELTIVTAYFDIGRNKWKGLQSAKYQKRTAQQ